LVVDEAIAGNHERETRSFRVSYDFLCSAYVDTPAPTDVLKGSYYANPLIDVPTVSAQDAKLYPEYYGKNICKFTVAIQIVDLTEGLPRAKAR
jgi:hypothetical protein